MRIILDTTIGVGQNTNLILHTLSNTRANLHIEASEMLTSHDVVASHCSHPAAMENLQWRNIALRNEEEQTLRHIKLVRTLIRIHTGIVESVGQFNSRRTTIEIQ